MILGSSERSDSFARWLLAQDSVRKAGFADIWTVLLNSADGYPKWTQYQSLIDEMIAIEKACSLSQDKENDDAKSQSKGDDVVKEEQMEMNGL